MIRDVQDRLKALGFNPGTVDNSYGVLTEDAIMAALWSLEVLRAKVIESFVGPTVDPETRLLIAELERDEGRVLHAYQDHLGYWTIGIGRLIDKRKGGGISNEEADYLKMNDVARVRGDLDRSIPWWRALDPVRQRAVQNMAFQLGTGDFHGATFALIRDGKFADAAKRLRGWLWANQTPARAERVIRMIETGAV